MEDKLVTIAQYMDSIKADIAKQTLEDFKIPAVIVGPNSGDLRVGALEMILLQVKQRDAERARQILETQEQKFTPEELEELDKMDESEGIE